MERQWRLDMYKDTVTWVGGVYQAPDRDVRWSFVQAFLFSASTLYESGANMGRVGPYSP
jgi:hypothetical protein